MASIKCDPCKGRGIINRDGKMTKTGKPYDVVCPSCNGIGHYRLPSTPSADDFENDDARFALSCPVAKAA